MNEGSGTDDSSSNEYSDSDDINYVRPVYQSPDNSIKKKKSTKRPNKSLLNKVYSNLNLEEEPKLKFIKFKRFERDIKSPAKINSFRTQQHFNETVKEYGEDIAGYKFLVTGQEFEKLEMKNKSNLNKKSSEGFAKLEKEQRTINELLMNAPARNIDNIEMQFPIDLLEKYWDAEDNTLTIVPVFGKGSLLDIEADDINSESISEFYEKSCHHFSRDLRSVLKAERVRWHPDRVCNALIRSQLAVSIDVYRKINKIFQIINELWGNER
ncbi:hypothetical protein TPHA_0B01080 [Tetrapisispora phaffii CBS 4417]|uniref:Uncharacterized protein n=1 Tax=Tetrapisispora phaffii (strain ATCC 24235 / CBS 4417 / NBRC 1672 / NRRL Y-8282 / UCD 70-5) TaxID=1071381 RepID=G8BQI3_TETPH|nr:hypothetical protein TPHA_0B01080 [Tetrapisispora phaffii CBS 4417]CCE61780.1 hypothetical protein TPHA_0B01080 [Tetrapisispora phaffii CBS 4417]